MWINNNLHSRVYFKGWGDFIFGFNYQPKCMLYIHIAQLGIEFLWGDWLKECVEIGIVEKKK